MVYTPIYMFHKKYSDELVKKAIELRKEGKSYDEISRIINVPKGSIIWWFKSRYRFV